jgi:hypothetical protein
MGRRRFKRQQQNRRDTIAQTIAAASGLARLMKEVAGIAIQPDHIWNPAGRSSTLSLIIMSTSHVASGQSEWAAPQKNGI